MVSVIAGWATVGDGLYPNRVDENPCAAWKQLELNPVDKRVLSLTAGYLFDIGEKEEALQALQAAESLLTHHEQHNLLRNKITLLKQVHRHVS